MSTTITIPFPTKSSFKRALPWIIAITVSGFFAWYVIRHVKNPIEDTVTYDRLQQQIDSVLEVDRIRTADSVRYKVIDSLTARNKNADEKIKKIQTNVDKKVSTYTGLRAVDIQRILSERYQAR